ncbi:hypothetical protein D3C78_1610930 [compost metagenome]
MLQCIFEQADHGRCQLFGAAVQRRLLQCRGVNLKVYAMALALWCERLLQFVYQLG